MKNSVLILAIFFSVQIFSQTLQNTTWRTYSTLYVDTITVTFGVDSMHQNGSSMGFIVSSIYTELGGDTVSFWDVGGNAALGCSASDTGLYRGIITGDSMELRLVSDACSNRGVSYDGTSFWKVIVSPPTGVSNLQEEREGYSIYPNPSSDYFNIESHLDGRIQVYSPSGQIIISSQYIKEGVNKIALPDGVQNGIYIVEIATGQRTVTKRIVINRTE